MSDTLAVCASHSPLIETVDGGAGGERFLEAVEAARTSIAEFAPDAVVFFGPDHSRALQNLVPAVSVVASARGYGDWGTPSDPYDVDDVLARELAEHLLAAHFDIALGEDIRLDHGFGQTFVQLFGGLGAAKCVPIVLNCARPPLPSLSRVIELGSSVGRFMADAGHRTLYVGSGGLSHQPPSMAKQNTVLSEEEREALARRTVSDAARHIDPVWDKSFLDSMVAADWSTLGAVSDADIDAVGTGTHEIRTWLAAWAAAGTSEGSFVYEPVAEWITGMGVAIGRS